MSLEAKTAFFDGIADKWDGWDDLDALNAKLAAGLRELGVAGDETIVDVGCGTGNLTRALLDALSPLGRVLASDLSRRMIDAARAKISDARVDWHVGDAVRLPLDNASCDRVMCYSVWPHFEDYDAIACEFSRVLRPSCPIHIWHLMGRARINAIHAGAGEAVHGDLLGPATETADLLRRSGFDVTKCVDTEDQYLVTATKKGG